MTDEQSGTRKPLVLPHPARGDASSPASSASPAALVWPASYSTPRLQKFGTLTELTLSGAATGNFETNLLTQKFRPKPKS